MLGKIQFLPQLGPRIQRISGSHIGYDEVVEVNKDDSYRKYYFTNFGTDLNGISHYDQPPLMTLGWTSADGLYNAIIIFRYRKR